MLRDSKAQAAIDRDGVVVLPFLNAEEVQELKDYYHAHTKDFGRKFHSTLMSEDMGYRLGVNEAISRVFEPALQRTFTDHYRNFIGSYAVKEPGENSAWAVHQDWSFTDEQRYRTVVVWCPLVDVDLNNGCVGFLKGSHNLKYTIRGRQTVSEYADVSDAIREKYLDFYPMKAGEVAIFFGSTVHYSPDNIQGPTRVTATVMMVPKQAQMLHYYRDPAWPQGEIEVLEVDTDYLLKTNVMDNRPPQGLVSRGRIQHPVNMLSEADIVQMREQRRKAAKPRKFLGLFRMKS